MAGPEQDYANLASSLLERQGQANAQAALQKGAIWGGTLQTLGQNIGQTIEQAPFRAAALQEAQTRQQIAQMQIEGMRRQQAAEQALTEAYSKSVGPDGQIDFGKFTAAAVGTPAAIKIPEVAQHIAAFKKTNLELSELQGKVAEKERDQVSAIANAADAVDDPMGKANVLLSMVSNGVQNGTIQKEHVLPMVQSMLGPDGQVDPAQVPRVISTLKQFSATDAEKRAQAAQAQARAGLATAQLPGAVAESQIRGQVAAGTQGGITPEQQQTNVLRGRELNLGEQRLQAELPHIQAQTQLSQANAAKAGLEADQLKQLQGVTGAGVAVPDVTPGQKNQAFLDTLQPGIASQVKALAEGRMQFPSGFALRSPYWQGLLQAVAKYDPSFDAINYNARAKTRQDFTAGKAAQQVNAMNTVVGHLAELSDKADALNNTSVPFINSVKNMMSRAGGSEKVTNFETAKQAVADELTRVYRQAGGSEQDIKSWESSLNAANSPAQLHGAFNTIGNLLESKLQAMQNQYEQGMGTSDIQMISPKARAGLDKLEGKASQAGTAKTIEKFGATYQLGADGLYHKVK